LPLSTASFRTVLDGVFDAAEALIEDEFGRDARIGAGQDYGEGVLAGFAFVAASAASPSLLPQRIHRLHSRRPSRRRKTRH
jgi:hypothetical protein